MFLPEQSEVDRFLPPNQYPLPLDPNKPVAMGDFAPPIIYSETKKAQEVNLRAAKGVILQCWNKFGHLYQRYYSPVESYRTKGAKALLLTMGSFSETAMIAIDKMRSEVDQFIPPYHHPLPLDPDKPVTMGAFAPPFIYSETKKAQEVNLRAAMEVILKCWDDFGRSFGRYYSPVECYHSMEAKILLLTMGSFSETAMAAVDKMRADGRDVGQITLRLWRPFPFEEIRQAVKNAEVLIVLDRALSFGGPPGPVCSEIRSALYSEDKKPKVISIVGGLGGRDISVTGFEEIVNKGIEISLTGSEQEFEMFGVRE